MGPLFAWMRKYWRAIIMFCCVAMMLNSYSAPWGISVWKAPDQYTVYTNQYGATIGRERTQVGLMNFNGISIPPSIELLSTLVLFAIVFMYWRKMKRRFIAIPYGILFVLMWYLGSLGSGGQQFLLFLFIMGIVIFFRRKRA